MADKINSLKKWTNNERLNARDYVYERDKIASTVNTIIDDQTVQDGKITALETEVGMSTSTSRIDDLETNKLARDGSQTMLGNLNLNSNELDNVAKVNETTFEDGYISSDAVRYTELANVFNVSVGDGQPSYKQTLKENIDEKFSQYVTNATVLNSFYTETEVDNLLDDKSDTDHTHPQSDIDNLTTDLQSINNTLNTLQGAYVLRGAVTEGTEDLTDTTPLTTKIDELLQRTPATGDVLRDANGGEWYFDGTNWTFVGQAYIDLDNYYTQTDLNDGALDTRYYTEAEVNPQKDDPENPGTDIPDLDTTGLLDERYYTEKELDPSAADDANVLDVRYYREGEVDTALSGKIDLNGDNSALNSLRWVHDATDPQNVVYSTTTYDSDRQILSFATPDGTSLNIGGELWFVNAKTNDALVSGDLVQFAGTQGDHYLVKKAVGSEIQANPEYFVGVATHTANVNDYVKVTWFGEVSDISTDGWSEGDILYFDTSTGGFTNVEPTTKPIIQIAAVTKLEDGTSNNGRVLVRPKFISRDAKEVFVDEILDGESNVKLAAATVQNTVETLYDKTQAHIDDTEAAHAASAISFNTENLPSIFTENDVKGIIEQFFNSTTNKIKADLIPFEFNDVLQYADTDAFPQPGDEIEPEADKLYIDLSTNSLYRWDGSAYQAIIEIQDLTGIGDINGVSISNEQNDDVLKWNATNSSWVNGKLDINELEDVIITAGELATKNYLKWDATANEGNGAWVNAVLDAPVIDSLDAIEGVNATNPNEGDFLRWDPNVGESGEWVLDRNIDVSDTPPDPAVPGDLWFDSSSLILYVYYNDGTSTQWVNAVSGIVESQPEELSDLTDVDVASATDQQVLQYNATANEWQPGTITIPAETGLANVEYYTTTISTGDWSGTDPSTAVKTVSGVLSTDKPLIDIDLSSVAFGDIETTQTEYAKLYRVAATANDEITFYALEAPTENLTIEIQVVR